MYLSNNGAEHLQITTITFDILNALFLFIKKILTPTPCILRILAPLVLNMNNSFIPVLKDRWSRKNPEAAERRYFWRHYDLSESRRCLFVLQNLSTHYVFLIRVLSQKFITNWPRTCEVAQCVRKSVIQDWWPEVIRVSHIDDDTDDAEGQNRT